MIGGSKRYNFAPRQFGGPKGGAWLIAHHPRFFFIVNNFEVQISIHLGLVLSSNYCIYFGSYIIASFFGCYALHSYTFCSFLASSQGMWCLDVKRFFGLLLASFFGSFWFPGPSMSRVLVQALFDDFLFLTTAFPLIPKDGINISQISLFLAELEHRSHTQIFPVVNHTDVLKRISSLPCHGKPLLQCCYLVSRLRIYVMNFKGNHHCFCWSSSLEGSSFSSLISSDDFFDPTQRWIFWVSCHPCQWRVQISTLNSTKKAKLWKKSQMTTKLVKFFSFFWLIYCIYKHIFNIFIL